MVKIVKKKRRTSEAATLTSPFAPVSGTPAVAQSSVAAVLLQGASGREAAKEASLSSQFSELFAGCAPSSAGGVFVGSAFGTGGGSSPSSSLASTPKGDQTKVKDTATRSARTDSKAASSSAAAETEIIPKKRKLSETEATERESRTLFVGNVPLSWDEKKLKNALREAVGDKYTGSFKPIWFRAIPFEGKWNWSDKMKKGGAIQKAYSNDSDSKNAYVVLQLEEDVPVVVRAVNNLKADESHVLRADGCGKQAVLNKFDRKRSVFIGNLPQRATEADLRKAMEPAGTVDAVRLVRDKATKECKGFAFVRFKDRWSVKEAFNLWGAQVQGRPIRVMKVEDDKSAEREERQRSKGGDGSNHPAEQRMKRREQKQRKNATKRKEFIRNAKGTGLMPGRKKRKAFQGKKKS